MSFGPEADGPQQPELPFPCDEDCFRRKVENALGKTISLTVTNNSTSMISVRTRRAGTAVRIHRVFLGAGPPVIDEIAAFIKNGRGKTPSVRAFIRQNRGLLGVPHPRRQRNLRAEGAWHSLADIARKINAEYFENRVTARITWGARGRPRAVRRRTLGSYSGDTGIITINRMLDNRTIPRYFVEFIVYHEMLHADIGVKIRNGRRLMHTGEFRARERLFRGYERAITWEKKWTLGN
jgi:hypothetical protein